MEIDKFDLKEILIGIDKKINGLGECMLLLSKICEKINEQLDLIWRRLQ